MSHHPHQLRNSHSINLIERRRQQLLITIINVVRRNRTITCIYFLSVLAVISVSGSQSPLITITSRGSPSRSEIHFSPAPNSPKSTLREIHVSRPDSSLVPINRQGNNTSSITYANRNDHSFHASHGASTTTSQRDSPVTSPPPTVHTFGRAPSVSSKEKIQSQKYNFSVLPAISSN